MSSNDLVHKSLVERIIEWLNKITRPRNPDKVDAWREQLSFIFIDVAIVLSLIATLVTFATSGDWLTWLIRFALAIPARLYSNRNPVWAGRLLLLAFAIQLRFFILPGAPVDNNNGLSVAIAGLLGSVIFTSWVGMLLIVLLLVGMSVENQLVALAFGLIVWVASFLLENAIRKNYKNAVELEEANAELRLNKKKVEQRLAERTADFERKTKELEVARQEVVEATRVKAIFLTSMSHEIRTPMNGVMGMTGLLLDTRLTPEQREFAETIRSSSQSLLAVINDILDFSKLEAGRMDLERQPFDLRQCVEAVMDLVAPSASKKGLDLAFDMEADVPAAIAGDVTRLRQIILNLLSNAIKFTETGEVEVHVSKQPNLVEGNHVLLFSVRDTGPGISSEGMDHLFQSFSQLDGSVSRRYTGSGLGLAISKRLAELMGGTMWVKSEGVPGKGSTFFFTIQAKAATLSKPDYMEGHDELNNKRVLLVDDNTTNRRILVLRLGSWGMVPTSAASPFAALERIKKNELFDIAIIDMQMEEMNGEMLAREIRKYRDAETLSLVALTSSENPPASDLFDAVLTKPAKQSQLFNALLTIFALKSALKKERVTSEFDSSLGRRVPLRILIAEDNVVNQKLAVRMLERMGYRPDVVANGLEALDALRRLHYDLVLMDVQMPEMDGLEAARQIRREWKPGQRPNIIAMTANAMAGDREACIAAGMDDYVSKPIQLKDLQLAIEHWGIRR